MVQNIFDAHQNVVILNDIGKNKLHIAALTYSVNVSGSTQTQIFFGNIKTVIALMKYFQTYIFLIVIASVDENTAQMKDAIANVRTGQVTYAIKDTTVDGREIHEGDYMGLFEKDIIVTSRDKLEASRALIDEMMDEDSEIVTLIRGKDATEEECTELEEYIRNNYEADVDVQDGGQPVYSFIIGVE